MPLNKQHILHSSGEILQSRGTGQGLSPKNLPRGQVPVLRFRILSVLFALDIVDIVVLVLSSFVSFKVASDTIMYTCTQNAHTHTHSRRTSISALAHSEPHTLYTMYSTTLLYYTMLHY